MNQSMIDIHMQVMWNRLISVVEEQAQTLIRTAFSTSVREAGDLSAGVFDLEGHQDMARSGMDEWSLVAHPHREAEQPRRLDIRDHHHLMARCHGEVAALADPLRKLAHRGQGVAQQILNRRLGHAERE